jgi:hypothetical protein
VGEHLWKRKMLIGAVVVAATFALGSFVFAQLQSNIGPGRPTFVMQISTRGAHGDFDAIAANRGQRPSAATCTVEAFDIYGNTIGTKGFDLGRLAPGEPLGWSGHVRVDARVERMSIDCR